MAVVGGTLFKKFRRGSCVHALQNFAHTEGPFITKIYVKVSIRAPRLGATILRHIKY